MVHFFYISLTEKPTITYLYQVNHSIQPINHPSTSYKRMCSLQNQIKKRLTHVNFYLSYKPSMTRWTNLIKKISIAKDKKKKNKSSSQLLKDLLIKLSLNQVEARLTMQNKVPAARENPKWWLTITTKNAGKCSWKIVEIWMLPTIHRNRWDSKTWTIHFSKD